MVGLDQVAHLMTITLHSIAGLDQVAHLMTITLHPIAGQAAVVQAGAGFIPVVVIHFIGSLDLQVYTLLVLIQYLPTHHICLLITQQKTYCHHNLIMRRSGLSIVFNRTIVMALL